MAFLIQPVTANILHLNRRIWCSKREQFRVLFPSLRHMAPINDRDCRLTMPDARDAERMNGTWDYYSMRVSMW